MVGTTRSYTTRRSAITKALADKLALIDGRGIYHTAVAETSPRLKFWDEVEEFPAIHINAASETRTYQTGGYKDRFLNLTIRCYVNEEDAVTALDELLEDVETVLETKSHSASKEIDLKIKDSPSNMTSFEIPGMPGAQMGMLNIGDMLGKAMGDKYKSKKILVKDSYEILLQEESDNLLDHDTIVQEALKSVQNHGIVFIDEIDKICARENRQGADVSREGVQRDLLPLIEGTSVSTKHGIIKTDHILFITSGAFHLAKPSDLLPELQGRLPIRVELGALSKEDFVSILTDTEASLIKQYIALMDTEGLKLKFSKDAIEKLADIAVSVNSNVENIGARRLHTVLERVLDDISFTAPDLDEKSITIDQEYVINHIEDLANNADLSKFIL